jgi:anti-sigma regulatory factor (Ser/Thr protein kinase)
MTHRIVLYDDLSEIERLTEFMDQLVEELELDFADGYNLHLALEEACSNIIRYAYPGETGKTFCLDVEANEKSVVFTLTDSGIPFNPLENAPEVDITLSAEEREIGGLGIFLIKNVMSSVAYERRGGENILTMTYLRTH